MSVIDTAYAIVMVPTVITRAFLYFISWVSYMFLSILDQYYSIVAQFINSVFDFASALFEFICVAFAWSGPTCGPYFIYFVATLVFMTLFFTLARLLILLKDIIVRWL